MKKILLIVAVITVAALAGSALAAEMPMVIQMKKGVVFSHKKHAEFLNKDCKKCHENAKGGYITGNVDDAKIDGFGREYAHEKCKDCHHLMKKGPLYCNGCHTKY